MTPERYRRGKMIKDARINKGLTQAEVADALGYSSPQFVSNAERGLCDITFADVPKLCSLLAISPNHMVASYVEETRQRLEEKFAAQSGRGKSTKRSAR